MKKKIILLVFAAFCFAVTPMVIQSCSTPSSGTSANPSGGNNTKNDDPNDKNNKKDDPNDPNDND